MALCVHSFWATAVDTATSCHFISSENCLVLLQALKINIYLCSEVHGLQFFTSIPLFSTVKHIRPYRPPGLDRDYLFVVLNDDTYFSIYWDEDYQKVIVDHPPVRYRVTFPWNRNAKSYCLVDLRMRAIFLSIDEISMICIRILSAEERLKTGRSIDSGFPFSFPVHLIYDMCILNDSSTPTLVVLHSDGLDCYVTAFLLDLSSKSLGKGIRLFERVKPSMIMPFGKRGLLVFESLFIHCMYRGNFVTINGPCTTYMHWTPLKGQRMHYIVCDTNGYLFGVYSSILGKNKWSLVMERLPIPPFDFITSLNSIHEGLLFIGSKNSESKLINLSTLKDVDSIPNLGPIHDLLVLKNDIEKSFLVCAGTPRNASLIYFQHALKLDILGQTKISGILRAMVLPSYPEHKLFLGFPSETVAFNIKEDFQLELDPSLSTKERTIALSGTNGEFVQVTSTFLCIYDSAKRSRLVYIEKITNAACYQEYSAIVINGTALAIFKKDTEIARKVFESEISCLDFSAQFQIGVGFWSKQVMILTFSDNSSISCAFQANVPSLPRNIILEGVGVDRNLLLVSSGSGEFKSYVLFKNNLVFSETKHFGTTPVSFRRFTMNIGTYIICNNDCPHMVYGFNGALCYMPLSMPQSYDVCQFRDNSGKDFLISVSLGGLKFLQLNPLPELTPRKVLLEHVPLQAIIFQNKLLLSTLENRYEDYESYKENYHLELVDSYDDNSFRVFSFTENERCEKVLKINESSLLVGTSIIEQDELVPVNGRLIMLEFEKELQSLKVVSSMVLSAAVIDLGVYNDRYIVAFGQQVAIVKLTEERLMIDSRISLGSIVLQLIVEGNEIAIADSIGRFTIMYFDGQKFIVVARYLFGENIVKAALYEGTVYIIATNSGLLKLLRYNKDAKNFNDRFICESVYHLHDKVSKFQNFPITNTNSFLEPKMLFATEIGAIGSIVSLKDKELELEELTRKIRKLKFSYLSSMDYESIEADLISPVPFIDGDLVIDVKRWASSELFRLCRSVEHRESLNSYQKVQALLEEIQSLC